MKLLVVFYVVVEKVCLVIIIFGMLLLMNMFEVEFVEKFLMKIEVFYVVLNDYVYVEVTSAIGEVMYKVIDGYV